jgi:predicted dehydrogenase
MSDNIIFDKTIWLIGAGDMAINYSKVLDGLNQKYTVVGRGHDSAEKFLRATGHEIHEGGVESLISTGVEPPDYAIIAVCADLLKDVTIKLINFGVKRILVEKPAGLNLHEIEEVSKIAKHADAKVFVAYNRRFLSSVIEAQKIIEQDGGVTSFDFEFTEWAHVIEKVQKPAVQLENWFIANSTHVVDLAFFLGGEPTEISCYVAGGMPWYKRASAFAGAGVSDKGALFSYKANWQSAGRWVVEILTEQHKLIFAPLEKLQIQNRGSVQVDFVKIDDELDLKYKPGLYLQTKSFLNDDTKVMIDIEGQKHHAKIYEMMEKVSYAHIDNN